MYIERLQLSNFKNYEDVDIEFSNNVNCFVGNNGVGKTNLLDALYYLSFCKSYFNPIDGQNIRNGADFFAIHGHYVFNENGNKSLAENAENGNKSLAENAENGRHVVSCTMKRGQSKRVKMDKRRYTSFSDHIGRVPLVMVTPSDQALITGGSEVRRKFIDGIISQVDRNYLKTLLDYQRALVQRNQQLKRFYENRYFEEESIAVWDEQIVRHGALIEQGRVEFLRDFMPCFEEYYGMIHPEAGEVERPLLKHLMQAADADSLREQLLASRRRDAQMQYTTVGPHKDDLEFEIGGMAAKRFGSQGQQKTFMLALKLAQFDYIYKKRGVKPILLLDDVFDKLDMDRVSQLVLLVGSDRFGQVFITDTQQGRVESIFRQAPDMPHKVFQVRDCLIC